MEDLMHSSYKLLLHIPQGLDIEDLARLVVTVIKIKENCVKDQITKNILHLAYEILCSDDSFSLSNRFIDAGVQTCHSQFSTFSKGIETLPKSTKSIQTETNLTLNDHNLHNHLNPDINNFNNTLTSYMSPNQAFINTAELNNKQKFSVLNNANYPSNGLNREESKLKAPTKILSETIAREDSSNLIGPVFKTKKVKPTFHGRSLLKGEKNKPAIIPLQSSNLKLKDPRTVLSHTKSKDELNHISEQKWSGTVENKIAKNFEKNASLEPGDNGEIIKDMTAAEVGVCDMEVENFTDTSTAIINMPSSDAIISSPCISTSIFGSGNFNHNPVFSETNIFNLNNVIQEPRSSFPPNSLYPTCNYFLSDTPGISNKHSENINIGVPQGEDILETLDMDVDDSASESQIALNSPVNNVNRLPTDVILPNSNSLSNNSKKNSFPLDEEIDRNSIKDALKTVSAIPIEDLQNILKVHSSTPILETTAHCSSMELSQRIDNEQSLFPKELHNTFTNESSHSYSELFAAFAKKNLSNDHHKTTNTTENNDCKINVNNVVAGSCFPFENDKSFASFQSEACPVPKIENLSDSCMEKISKLSEKMNSCLESAKTITKWLNPQNKLVQPKLEDCQKLETVNDICTHSEVSDSVMNVQSSLLKASTPFKLSMISSVQESNQHTSHSSQNPSHQPLECMFETSPQLLPIGQPTPPLSTPSPPLPSSNAPSCVPSSTPPLARSSSLSLPPSSTPPPPPPLARSCSLSLPPSSSPRPPLPPLDPSPPLPPNEPSPPPPPPPPRPRSSTHKKFQSFNLSIPVISSRLSQSSMTKPLESSSSFISPSSYVVPQVNTTSHQSTPQYAQCASNQSSNDQQYLYQQNTYSNTTQLSTNCQWPMNLVYGYYQGNQNHTP